MHCSVLFRLIDPSCVMDRDHMRCCHSGATCSSCNLYRSRYSVYAFDGHDPFGLYDCMIVNGSYMVVDWIYMQDKLHEEIWLQKLELAESGAELRAVVANYLTRILCVPTATHPFGMITHRLFWL